MVSMDSSRSETTSFASLFGREPEQQARAPGRVNLIGEHTDYNGGYVLPTVVPQEIRVQVAVRHDQTVRAWSDKTSEGTELLEYRLGDEARGHGWLDHLQGTTRVLAEAGHRLRGVDVRITSSLPIGRGLASSAALQVALLRGLREALGLHLDDLHLALLGQRAEGDLVATQAGIADYMAVSFAAPGQALFLDTQSMEMERVVLPAGLELVVLHSGFDPEPEAAHGDYRTRRLECASAAEVLGVSQLRDIGIDQVDRLDTLPEPFGRRVRHVVLENERVLAAVEAMRAGDLPRLGELFVQSQRSMRDELQISIPALDLLVELAQADDAILGARLTGAGFGGAVIMLARRGSGASAAARVARAYEAKLGRPAQVLVPPVETPA